MKVAGLIFLIHDVHGVGLQSAQGVLLTEPFYWNMNAGTRAFGEALRREDSTATMPGSVHAGQYSAVTHYLKSVVSVGYAKAKASGRAVIEAYEGDADRRSVVRQGHGAQGWAGHSHDVSVRGEVAGTIEGPWDYYNLKRTVPAAEAFRPINQGGCSLV
jgi:branched-chain amino acid transport system substrate-binding protein